MDSRRAQGRRGRQEEIDGLSASRPTTSSSSAAGERDQGRKARETPNLGEMDSAFQHGATEMGIGKKQYQHLATLGPPFSSAGAGGFVVRARLGAAKEKTGKRTIYCNGFSQSSFAIHLCAHQNRPWSFLCGRLPAFLRFVHCIALLCESVVRRGKR